MVLSSTNQTTIKLDDGRVAQVITPTLTSRSVQIRVFNNETGRYETAEIYSDNPLYKAITGNSDKYNYYQNRIESEQKLLEKYQKQAKLFGEQVSIFGNLSKKARNTAYALMRENNITSISQIDNIENVQVREEIKENYTNASTYKCKRTSASCNEYSALLDAFLQVFHLDKAKREQQLFT